VSEIEMSKDTFCLPWSFSEGFHSTIGKVASGSAGDQEGKMPLLQRFKEVLSSASVGRVRSKSREIRGKETMPTLTVSKEFFQSIFELSDRDLSWFSTVLC
jgi:hypothetical protein